MMSSGQLVQIWRLHKKNESMTIGMSTRTEFVIFMDRIHKIYIIERNSSGRVYVAQVWTDKKNQTTSRPDHIWPDAWTRIGKAAQRRNKNGNRETAMPCTRPCSRTRIRETVVLKTTRANVSEVKKRPICIDIAGKGRNSVLHHNFVQEFVPMKRSDQSSSPNFLLKVKASACCLASRHSVPVEQNSSSNPKPRDSHVWT